jgi:pantetheine-phosphate adenylyltransferase
MTIGIFAGTFDPITYGHSALIYKAMDFCDHLYIAIGINPAKTPLFSLEERISFIKEAINDREEDFTIKTFDGLLVDFVRELKPIRNSSKLLIRGVRSATDFEYESNLALINQELNPLVQTVLLISSPSNSFISSSMVKEVARHGHDVRNFVYPTVSEALIKKNIKG